MLNGIMADDGTFNPDKIEHLPQAYAYLEAMFKIILFLADGDAETISNAQEALDMPPLTIAPKSAEVKEALALRKK